MFLRILRGVPKTEKDTDGKLRNRKSVREALYPGRFTLFNCSASGEFL